MSYFKKTNAFKEMFFSRFTVVILFILITFAGFSLYSIIVKSMDASHERKMAEVEVSNLHKKQSDLSAKIEMLKTPEGQTEALKEQYPVVSPGEKVVVITEDDGTSGATSSVVVNEKRKGFLDYLKNLVR